MKRGVSIYLDLIRVGAALVVFLSHFAKFAGTFQFVGAYAHQAVIAFFVISGYVIAYVSTERETDLVIYAISRATRIYSVVIPALIITAAVDLYLQGKGVDVGRQYQFLKPWKYVPFFMLFGTDWWFFNEDAFSNVPYWSLCYEVWYYVLFAAYRYFTGYKRYLLCGAILLLIGPRLWLLLPIWLSGAWLYHVRARTTWPKGVARAIWAVTLLGLTLLLFGGLYTVANDALFSIIGNDFRQLLRYSQYFVGDYLLTALIVLNIYSVFSCDFQYGYAGKQICYLATLTFSLYLFHYPLLELFSYWFQPIPLAIATLVSVWGLARLTEWLRITIRSRTTRMLIPRNASLHSG